MSVAHAVRMAPSGAGLRQVALVLAALALCPVASLLVGDDPGTAIGRTQALVGAERALGIHVEPAMHAWLLERPGLLTAASVFYVFAHVPVAGWALIWTWYLRRDRFAAVRDVFIGTQVVLIAAYVALPTAPPRLVPGAGFSDTFTWTFGQAFADSAHLLQSPYAAMPSGHVAFALVAGATFARLGDQAWLRAFGWAYPGLVVAITMLTGHHLLLDAVGAVAVVAAVGAAVRRRSR